MKETINPFSPGAGSPPPELVGRDELLHDAEVLLHRAKNGRAAKSMIINGLRGVGKTVLLMRVASMARDIGYRTLQIEVDENNSFLLHLVQGLRSILLSMGEDSVFRQTAKKALSILKSFAGVSIKYKDFSLELDIDASRGMADSGQLEIDLPVLFSAIGEVAAQRGTGIALLIDEIQFLSQKELGALTLTMHKMQQEQLPIVLVSAGLPVMYELAGQAKSYSERLFQFPVLSPLSRKDSWEAIRRPIEDAGQRISDEALDSIHAKTRGFPYFLQEWGYHTWNVAEEGKTIDTNDVLRANDEVIRRLDESFFRVRFNRVTPAEREFLHAMALFKEENIRSSDIAHRLDKRVNAIGTVRINLIRKGMIYSPSYGYLAFTVPLFGEFLLRTMGE